MNARPSLRGALIASAFGLAGLLYAASAPAQLADLADVPLANSPSTSVLPNLMYILDDSGSMQWNYMPDQIQRTSRGEYFLNCKRCNSTSCGNGPGGRQNSGFGASSITLPSGTPCGNDDTNANVLENSTSAIPTYGEAPFYATRFNQIWYNPDITYAPAVDSAGVSLGNQAPNNASRDAFLGGGSDNLVNQFQEVIYCNTSTPTGADLNDTSKCRYNGRHNVSPFLGGQPDYFLYWTSGGTNVGLPTATFFHKVRVTNSNPHYYSLTPHEYCSDSSLVNCALATAGGASPGGTNTIAAPLRWCRAQADATTSALVSGNAAGTPRCVKKFDRVNYPYPRYGRFQRVDIVPATANYPKGASSLRIDCASATSCSYAEEVQNFANWYGYYRTRFALMKTATGRAFLSIDDRYRIGLITINPGSPVDSDKYVAINKFDTAQRSTFYRKLYDTQIGGGTPLREALSRVGRHYAGITSGINSQMTPDPLQYSCQQNYALLTTDGYWNSNAGQTISGSAIADQDNTNSGFTTRAVGAYDGNRGGAAVGTLADVAAYYYKQDLRTAGPLSPNNVPTNEKDTQPQQHMVTFTLGLGLEGLMDFRPDYEIATSGDFAKIKAGTNNACAWISGTCDWPPPVANDPSTLDDLWHAAVNSRGQYFSASDPNSLAQGLQSALSKLKVATAAAAASATSSPNITETDNFIYSSTFRTGEWDGQVVAQRIDTTTGNVLAGIVWSAQALLDARTSDNADSRNIFTIDEGGANKRKAFSFATLSAVPSGALAAEQPYFSGKCGALSQCTLLTLAQQALANNGVNLVSYLRGQRQFEKFTAPETTAPYRTRAYVLGDPVNATPAFVKTPQFSFTDAVTPTYAAYKIAQASRTPVLYIAANDGMLHALNGDSGQEIWAYVPRIVMPGLHRLATANWGATHRFSVDGSPSVMDVFIGGGWKTVLVAGLNSGGRGYYALDVTDPATPKVLWELCSDATICAISDPDVGFTYGNPVISKRASDGRWVAFVTSGMNNVTPGTGQGYLFTIDIQTGAVLSKVSTAEGTATFPSGLSKISGFADNFTFNNTAKFIYGGDLLGNVWKFDTSSSPPAVRKLAFLRDVGGAMQSVTARPELALIDGFPVVYVGTGRYLGEDDLPDPATFVPPLPFAYRQSLYAIKDKGTSYGNFRGGAVVENTIIDAGTTRTTSQNPVDWSVQDGWFLDFNPGDTSPGERVNLDPQLVQGTLVVATNVPNNSACSVGGDSWIYQFDYRTGQFVKSSAGGVAGQKYTGQITVGIVVVRLPSGVFKGIATGATGTKTPFAINIGGSGGVARRISWRELIQR